MKRAPGEPELHTNTRSCASETGKRPLRLRLRHREPDAAAGQLAAHDRAACGQPRHRARHGVARDACRVASATQRASATCSIEAIIAAAQRFCRAGWLSPARFLHTHLPLPRRLGLAGRRNRFGTGSVAGTPTRVGTATRTAVPAGGVSLTSIGMLLRWNSSRMMPAASSLATCHSIGIRPAACSSRSDLLSRPTSDRKRTPGGHGLLAAVPRSYQVTPGIPDRRRATQQRQGRPPRPTASKRVSSPPGRDLLLSIGHHRQPRSKQQASKQEPRGSASCWVARGEARLRAGLRPRPLRRPRSRLRSCRPGGRAATAQARSGFRPDR